MSAYNYALRIWQNRDMRRVIVATCFQEGLLQQAYYGENNVSSDGVPPQALLVALDELSALQPLREQRDEAIRAAEQAYAQAVSSALSDASIDTVARVIALNLPRCVITAANPLPSERT